MNDWKIMINGESWDIICYIEKKVDWREKFSKLNPWTQLFIIATADAVFRVLYQELARRMRKKDEC